MALSDTSQLTPQQKRELLRVLLKGGEAVPVQPPQASYPLSAAQRRLWFLHQLEPESGRYHIVVALKMEGPFNPETFQRALNLVVKRHESLRTTFRFDGFEPVQQVLPTLPIRLACAEVNQGSPEERQQAAEEMLTAEARRVFDLENGPLLRAGTIRIASGVHRLYLVMHHIISDGWSMRLLIRELIALSVALEGPNPELPPAPSHQYKDYAMWQRGRENSVEATRQLEYWQQRLKDAPALQRLPFDRPRPKHLSDRGASIPFCIPQEIAGRLRELCRELGVTLYAGLLAAFQTLLYRYSCDEIVVTGFPVAGRLRREWEPIIGLFANTLVMATPISPEKPFTSLVEEVSERLIEAQANQDLPFDVLVEHLRPSRNLSHHPVFQTVLLLEQGPEDLESGPLRFTDVDTGFTKFDLTLTLRPGASLTGYFEYSTDLFGEATIHRMGRHFIALLGSVVADPHQAVAELSFISSEEKRAALYEWNNTRTEYPAKSSVHRLFETQAARFADSPAIISGSARMTYAQLNAQANCLARELIRAGASPGGRIAIVLPQSPAVIIAILAVLKTGSAYVPLDPTHPMQRNLELIHDCDANLVVTDQEQGFVPAAVRTVIFSAVNDENIENLPQEVSAAAPAYIMYTSGSTGPPKGVVVPHRAVSRLVLNTNYITIEPTDRIAQHSTFLFDASIFEIFGPLLNGAAIVMIDKETVLSPVSFRAAAAEHRITAGFFTSSLFNHLVSAAPEAFHGFHHVLVGGEAVDPKWFAHLFRSGYRGEIINAYGPTEGTTFSICNVLSSWDDETAPVPLGQPVANTTAYVAGPGIKLLPPGAVGEILIGGDGLALGYVNDDTLTGQKFIPNPFEKGTYLYRTGDLGRYCANGEIEFLGRIDRQLKVRGYRIEPAEIESALEQHPAVLHAAVAATGSESTSRTLSAYIVPRLGGSAIETELREYLSARLPDYLVPARFISIESLPLTANGKLDHAKLIAVPVARQAPAAFVQVNPVLGIVLEIWRRLLGVEQITPDDNFFNIGGTSLLAVRMLSEVEKVLARRVPVALILRSPIAREFAHSLENEADAGFENLICLRPGDSRLAPLVLVHAGSHFYDILAHLRIENPVWMIPHPKLDQLSRLPSVEQIAAVSCSEVLNAFPHQSPILAGYCLSGMIGFEIARQLRQRGSEPGPVVLLDVLSPSYYWRRGWFNRIALRCAGLRRHLRIIRSSPARERGAKARHLVTKLRRAAQGDIFDTYFKMDEYYLAAARKYHPKFYPADVVLVRASAATHTDTSLGWKRFAQNVAIRDVACNHAELVKPDIAPAVAAILAVVAESR